MYKNISSEVLTKNTDFKFGHFYKSVYPPTDRVQTPIALFRSNLFFDGPTILNDLPNNTSTLH